MRVFHSYHMFTTQEVKSHKLILLETSLWQVLLYE